MPVIREELDQEEDDVKDEKDVTQQEQNRKEEDKEEEEPKQERQEVKEKATFKDAQPLKSSAAQPIPKVAPNDFQEQVLYSSNTELTPQQVSQLLKEKSSLEGKLSRTLETINLCEEHLEPELRQMMKFKELDKDSLKYVGSIKDCISYKDDIMAIQVCFKTLIFQVWIDQGLKEADSDHKIIKALGSLKLRSRSPSPKQMPVRD